jgi:hypothetical protein
MKRWLFAGAGLFAMLGFFGVVHGQPSGGQSGSAKASASASVRPPVAPSEWAEPQLLSSVTIPTTTSEKPKRDEWKDAVEVKVLARTTGAKRCRAQVLREWMRVSCPQVVAGIRQYVGPTKDVELFIYAKSIDNLWAEPNGGDVVFPLRKGEAYLFQFFEVSSNYEGFGVSQSMLVDVSWSGGRKAPTVVIR